MKPPSHPDATFLDTQGRGARWAGRVSRPARWAMAGALGQPRDILVELRWRLGDEIMARPVVERLIFSHPRDRVWLWTSYPELYADLLPAQRLNESPARPHRYVFLREDARTQRRNEHYARLAGVAAPEDPPRIPAPSMPSTLAERFEGLPGPRVAIAPGASWAIKRWPGERWAALVEALRGDGVSTIELGRGDDAVAGVDWSLMDQTTVSEAASVLAACDAVVCCDSGLMHLALAVGTPTVALFGPTAPDFMTPTPLLHALRSNRECAGFWNRAAEVPPPGTCMCGDPACFVEISVESVVGAVGQVLRTE